MANDVMLLKLVEEINSQVNAWHLFQICWAVIPAGRHQFDCLVLPELSGPTFFTAPT